MPDNFIVSYRMLRKITLKDHKSRSAGACELLMCYFAMAFSTDHSLSGLTSKLSNISLLYIIAELHTADCRAAGLLRSSSTQHYHRKTRKNA